MVESGLEGEGCTGNMQTLETLNCPFSDYPTILYRAAQI